jgi:hypothetical protein
MSVAAMNYVFALPIRSSPQRLLLLALANRVSDDTGRCFPGQALLAEECTMGVRQVRDHLAALERSGRISRRYRHNGNEGRTSDEYEILGFMDWLNRGREDARNPVSGGKPPVAEKRIGNRRKPAGEPKEEPTVSRSRLVEPLEKQTNVESVAAVSAREDARGAGAAAPRAVVSNFEKRPVPVPTKPKPSRKKRQGDFLADEPKQPAPSSVPPEQIDAAFAMLAEAMTGLWAGVTKTAKRKAAIRTIIENEGIDHIRAVADALRIATFARGGSDGKGWVIQANDLLFDEEKRAKLLDGGYGREFELKTKDAVDKTALTRFDPNKTAATVHGVHISGEDLNEILDAVPGASREMLRKAIRMATAKKASHFDLGRNAHGFDERYAKAQLDPILKFLAEELGWLVAYGSHGEPEALAGGKLFSVGYSYYDTLFASKARVGVSESFVAELRLRFPEAKHYCGEFESELRSRTGIRPGKYCQEFQRKLEAGLTKWAERSHQAALDAKRQQEEWQRQREEEQARKEAEARAVSRQNQLWLLRESGFDIDDSGNIRLADYDKAISPNWDGCADIGLERLTELARRVGHSMGDKIDLFRRKVARLSREALTAGEVS